MNTTATTSATTSLSPTLQHAVLSPPEQMGLQAGLAVEQVEELLLTASRNCDFQHRTLAFYIADVKLRRVYKQRGFPSLEAWADARFHLEARDVSTYARIGRRLLQLPQIDAAFAEGWLVWSKVELLSRISPDTQTEWLALARRMNCHQLSAELQRAVDGRPAPPGHPGLGRSHFKVQVDLDTVAYEDLELAKRKLGDELGHTITDAEFVREAIRLLLATNPDGTVAGRKPVKESHYKVVLRCAPAEGKVEVVTEHGPMPVPTAQLSELLCDGATVDSDTKMAPPIPDSLRRAILARDGHRCIACHSARDPHVHHVVWRENGGDNTPSNLMALCKVCHTLVHERYIIVEGEAPHVLAILDRQGLPLARRPNVAAPLLTTAPPPTPRFIELPDHVDAKWWQRHRHLLPWNDRRGVLELIEGQPIEEIADWTDVRHGFAAYDPTTACSLSDLVGHTRAVSALQVAIAAARHEARPLPHTLLAGPPGIGKTTIARALATAMDARLCTITAPLIDDVPKLIALLVALRAGDMLFVDEMHGLPRPVAEVLYAALEERRLSLPVAVGTDRRMLSIELAPFTCIGATTDEGSLPDALRARFPLRESLARLSDADVAQSLLRAATRSSLVLEQAAAQTLAAVAAGIPRDALALLGRARDEMLARGTSLIDEACASASLTRAGIDSQGLGPVEQTYLQLLGDGHPRALSQIAAHLGLPAATVARLHEPLLLRRDLIRITPRGRILTCM